MPKGYSIHVGVNQVTSTVFTAPPLERCEADAIAMFELAKKAHFVSPTTNEPALLLGPNATYKNVTDAIRAAGAALDPGDIFLFTFAGHGTSRFFDAGAGESNGPNETIVLVDHMLFDEVWKNNLWPGFKQDVRALAIADCCNSGGVFDAVNAAKLKGPFLRSVQKWSGRVTKALGFGGPESNLPRVRRLDDKERAKELDKFKDFYKEQTAPPADPQAISVSRILLSACKADEDALEGAMHGLFTQALIDVWNGGAFPGDGGAIPDNYVGLMTAIKSRFKGPSQHPQITPEGQPDFTNQRPFSIV